MTSLANNESAMDLLASPEVQLSMNRSGISEEELLVLRDHFGESPLVDSLEPCAMFRVFLPSESYDENEPLVEYGDMPELKATDLRKNVTYSIYFNTFRSVSARNFCSHPNFAINTS